jgi:hypothetical protein
MFNFAVKMADPLLALLVLLLGPALHFISRARSRTPLSRSVLDFFKASFVPHHYYEPVILERDLPRRLLHDVFTPRDYLAGLVIKERRLWNEQYILEALLTSSSRFLVVAALNFLATEIANS